MDNECSAWELVSGEIDKIRAVLAEYPQLEQQIAPSLQQIMDAVEAALPSPVLPDVSLKQYSESLPEAAELHAEVVAAGGRCEFHGYTFWPCEDQSWSLTNPYGFDDVMVLRHIGDFEDFLLRLSRGATIGPTP